MPCVAIVRSWDRAVVYDAETGKVSIRRRKDVSKGESEAMFDR